MKNLFTLAQERVEAIDKELTKKKDLANEYDSLTQQEIEIAKRKDAIALIHNAIDQEALELEKKELQDALNELMAEPEPAKEN